jgi:hypothetical protein
MKEWFQMQFVHWRDLGSPTRPGSAAVPEGMVQVTQLHIAVAAKHGGKCSFRLDDAIAYGCSVREYGLGRLAYPD